MSWILRSLDQKPNVATTMVCSFTLTALPSQQLLTSGRPKQTKTLGGTLEWSCCKRTALDVQGLLFISSGLEIAKQKYTVQVAAQLVVTGEFLTTYLASGLVAKLT